jgi:hypothetical protein
MRVALGDDRRAEGRQGERERVVALGCAVGQEERARGPVRLGGELLGPLVGRRPRAEVDALDVLRDVQLQGVGPDRRAQAGVRPLAALVAGHVEARRPAEPVGDEGVEVRGGGLLAGEERRRLSRARRGVRVAARGGHDDDAAWSR